MLTLKFLKDNCQKIHFFGLGFIQVKISDHLRFHFYTNSLPAIVGGEEVHNHRCNFSSRIIKGHIRQHKFSYVSNEKAEYEKVRVSCDVNIVTNPCREIVNLWRLDTTDHFPNYQSLYHLTHNEFHKIDADDKTITMVTKGEVVKPFAEVIKSIGKREICPFSKVVPEDELWDIIGGMLND